MTFTKSDHFTHPTAAVLLLIEDVPLADLAPVSPDLAPVAPDLRDDGKPPALLQPRGSWSVVTLGPDLAVVLTRVLNIAWSVMMIIRSWSVMMMMTMMILVEMWSVSYDDDNLSILNSPGTQGNAETGSGAAA